MGVKKSLLRIYSNLHAPRFAYANPLGVQGKSWTVSTNNMDSSQVLTK